MTSHVSRLFPCLHTRAKFFEDIKFDFFASFLVVHPCNIDSKCFCSNVLSFALAFRRIRQSFTRLGGAGGQSGNGKSRQQTGCQSVANLEEN